MNRKEWKRQSQQHATAARALFDQRQYSVAYHVAGLAVECALKAKIAASFKSGTWPDRQFVNNIHVHDLDMLVKYADLKAELLKAEKASNAFKAYWNVIKGWTVESRYKSWTQAEARDMVEAACKRGSGVLAWIRRNS
jgi:HEPN domain-containing protein